MSENIQGRLSSLAVSLVFPHSQMLRPALSYSEIFSESAIFPAEGPSSGGTHTSQEPTLWWSYFSQLLFGYFGNNSLLFLPAL